MSLCLPRPTVQAGDMLNKGRAPTRAEPILIKLINAHIQTWMVCPFFTKAGAHFAAHGYEHWPLRGKRHQPHPSKTSSFRHLAGLPSGLWTRLLFSCTFASAEKAGSFGKKGKKVIYGWNFIAGVLISEVWHKESEWLSRFAWDLWHFLRLRNFHAKSRKFLSKLGLVLLRFQKSTFSASRPTSPNSPHLIVTCKAQARGAQGIPGSAHLFPWDCCQNALLASCSVEAVLGPTLINLSFLLSS